MAASSALRSREPQHTIIRRGMRRKRSAGSLTDLLAAFVLVSTAALLGRYYTVAVGSSEGGSAHAEQSICIKDSAKTTCTCTKKDSSSEKGTATLSASLATLNLQCKGGLYYAPDKLKGTTVCPGNAKDVHNCTQPCLDLKNVLTGTSVPSWKGGEPEGEEGKTLTVAPENLPFVNKQFVVGCVKEENAAACTVAVAVNARPTEKTGQTVTCAYGENSNLTPQTVALNPSNRSFTLVCGEDGEVVPANYQASFCPVGAEKRDDQSGACTESYSQILPAYETSWWRNDGGKSSYTLTIPADKFPETEAKLNIRCQKKGASSSNRSEAPATPNPSVCSVDVTIEAAAASSSSPALAVTRLLLVVTVAGVISTVMF
ncbi:SAG-related sequence [Besnoitia besnoiti]|uniref:SAG-related sequence n=1 Tax=Besnoitia besnoiti TaxID=94643 RepID=A0A2A9MFR0_BESBE|nr:SAG-related sequence [Besnoitia besnoiti]PFH36835.1 SAG-related sequence [Besnoitia besnoiti]